MSGSLIAPPPPARGSATNRELKWAFPAALLLTFLAYSRTLTFGFVFDDRGQIIDNPYIRTWHYVSRFFTAQVWNFNDPRAVGNYYRPVFLLWLLVNRTLFGLHPSLWHLTNVLLHVGVTALVFLIVKELATDDVAALVAALVFGLHPVHIESVAWISGVTDPLAGFWVFASFWAYLVWRRKRKWAWLGASLASYAVAVLAKETALVLPILLLAYEWLWREPDSEAPLLARWSARIRSWAVRIGAFGVLSVAYLAARWLALQGLGHDLTSLRLSTIVMTWPLILALYMKHLLWPFRLSPFYDVPYVSTPSFRLFLFPLLVLIAIAGLLHVWSHRAEKTSPLESRLLAFACLWMLVPLLPLADLAVFAKGEIAHDRYLYIPCMGFALLVSLAVSRLRKLHRPETRQVVLGMTPAQMLAVAGMVLLLGISTAAQGHYWSDDLLLYSHGVAELPMNDILHTNLANVLGERGRYAESIKLYQEVLDRNQGDWSANTTLTRINLANVLGETGRYQEAIQIYALVLAHKPDEWSANYNLGYTEYKAGNLAEAQKFLQRAIAINELHGDQYLYLGLSQLKLNEIPQAEQSFRRAIQINPQGFAYHLAMGLVLNLEGKPDVALAEFKTELANYPKETAASAQIQMTEEKMRVLPALAPTVQRAQSPPDKNHGGQDSPHH